MKARMLLSIVVFVCLFPPVPACAQDWDALLEEAESLGASENYDSAVVIGELALEKATAEFGDVDTSVAQVLASLGRYYVYLGEHFKAETLFVKALDIRIATYGAEHHDVAYSMALLADAYNSQGRHVESERLFRQALAMMEKLRGPDNLAVAKCLSGLALVCRNQNRLFESERLYGRVLDIRQTALGPSNTKVAYTLWDLAVIYCRQGRYDEAFEIYLRILKIYEQNLGKEHLKVSKILNNLGMICRFQGRYAASEQFLNEALSMKRRLLRPNDPDVASTLRHLGALCLELSKFEQARQYYEQALLIYEEEMGPDHPAVASCLESLGHITLRLGNYPEAEKLLRKSIDITETSLNPGHLNLISSLLELTDVYMNQDRYAEADSLLQRALNICIHVYRPGHPETAEILNSLAVICMREGQYRSADSLFEMALAIAGDVFGYNHTSVAECYELISSLRQHQEKPEEAFELASKACRIRLSSFDNNAVALSERDALAFSKSYRNSVDRILTCFFDLETSDDSLTAKTADIIYSSKGQVSDEIFARQKALIEETDSLTQSLADQLRFAKFRLSELYINGPGQNVEHYRQETDSLGRLAERLEKDLSRHSASFREKKSFRDISAERIKSLLPERAALVECFKYNALPLEPGSSTPRYLALLMTEDSAPRIIDLGEAGTIDAAVSEYRRHMFRVATSGLGIADYITEEYRHVAGKLYEMIWRPVERFVSDEELILVSPDGELNTVSFAGLIGPDGKYMVEKFAIHYLSAGRDIVRYGDEASAGTGLFAVGDPDYDASVNVRKGGSDILPPRTGISSHYSIKNVRSGCGRLSEIFLNPLPATKDEVESVRLKWIESSDEPVAVYFGSEATEERFKADAPGCRVIHLATHGYYIDGACGAQPAHRSANAVWTAENPLLHSGLFFAGANLHGEGADSAYTDDGILTAYEVSAMALKGTQLVVLSACETALGAIETGEGVYGLRRAFQMAGARTVVSALWPVSDEVTSEMLSGLYERNGYNLPMLIREMELARIRKLRAEGKSDHPVSWGAFIALGDWR